MNKKLQRIRSKKDLQYFIAKDLEARGLTSLPRLYQIRKPNVYFTVLLRKVEYYQNCKQGYLSKLWCKYLQLKLKRLGAKLGFSISPNTFGPGLYLVHWGSVVISSEAKFGANARIHSCVNVSGAPVFGDHVYLGPGSVVVGDVEIGSHVAIGANSVVYTSFPDNITLLGNPARVVSKS